MPFLEICASRRLETTRHWQQPGEAARMNFQPPFRCHLVKIPLEASLCHSDPVRTCDGCILAELLSAGTGVRGRCLFCLAPAKPVWLFGGELDGGAESELLNRAPADPAQYAWALQACAGFHRALHQQAILVSYLGLGQYNYRHTLPSCLGAICCQCCISKGKRGEEKKKRHVSSEQVVIEMFVWQLWLV